MNDRIRRQETYTTKGHSVWERVLAQYAMLLVRSRAAWAGRALLRLLRLAWRHRQIRAEHATTGEGVFPTGPFKITRTNQVGDLLLWVPRGIDSYLIDELTGGYGYSHASIDTGEIDLPTGKPVMAEITVGQTVRHKFQDEYARRPYVRVPLRSAGVNVRDLIGCVESKMGERYDVLDALTLGEIEDPVKEVCSGLISDCLPAPELRRIALARRLGLLHHRSVSVHSRLTASRMRAFVSPNALAEYYGAPKGRTVKAPNSAAWPRPVMSSPARTAHLAARHQGWKLALGLVLIAGVAIAVRRQRQ